MHPNRLTTLLAALALAAVLQPPRAFSHDRTGEIMLNGRLNTSCIRHGGGPVFLHMDIITPDIRPRVDQDLRHMNIAVVLDRSGSMGDERKIDYARKAVNAVIDRLSSDDYLSIVIYDDRIETVLRTQRVTDKQRIKRLVEGIEPRGATNLSGGMIAGFQELEEHFRNEFVNRVILLSDGLANRGITDPHELNRVAGEYRDRSISLSTIGVGLEYNENLMLGLAEHGGGNYYFVESPSQLASIFEGEFNGLSSVVAQNAFIELTLGQDVTLNDCIGWRWHRDGDRWIIPVGDLYAKDHREFTVDLNIPEGSGRKQVANGILRYDGDRGWFKKHPGFSLDIHYSNDAAELMKGKDWDTQAKVDIALSTRQVERAMESLDAGRRDQAARELNDAKMKLESSPSLQNSAVSAPMMREAMKDLDHYSSEVLSDSTDPRLVKKSIQFRNYQTQKGQGKRP